ncbi:MAG: RIP metalloprotease RseP [Candidatus Omnitrophica bacterium]|nr:RIP metalloprotease RseP [Candidatus Omnitrophota bacterium]
MISILAFVLVLSILILVHEFGHFIVAKKAGVKVEKFSLGFGPVIFSLKRKDTQYCISLIPVGGYVKMSGDSPSDRLSGEAGEYLSQPVRKRMMIVSAGPALNYLLAFFVFWLVFLVGNPVITTKVGGIMKDYPAQIADIRPGDRIIKVGEKAVGNWEELTELIRKAKSETLDLVIRREDKVNIVTVYPKKEKIKNIFGKEEEVARIGITPSDEIIKIKYPFFEAASLALSKLISLTRLTFKAIFRLLIGGMALKETVSGPLGIFYVTKFAAEMGIVTLLNLLAVLSASLAIFNILPIPVLDGGHILFLLIEKFRGKAVSLKTQERITQIGIAALIALMVFVSYNDLVRFQIFEKIAHFWRK